ncbi:unnamed protein product [Phytomonas sp. EM1]|nr:unnamed protein product [Phytomonas sp. EM1]|eukprot:CCW62512.1 unnamed protein product [Phytomonas sp. isolate EM1]
MPLFKRDSGTISGFTPPAPSALGANSDATQPSSASATTTSNRHHPLLSNVGVPHFLNRRLSSTLGGTAVDPSGIPGAASTFEDVAKNPGSNPKLASAATKRVVLYPEARGITHENITAERLSKRAHIDYHQPESVKQEELLRKKTKADDVANGEVLAGDAIQRSSDFPARTSMGTTEGGVNPSLSESGAGGKSMVGEPNLEKTGEADDEKSTVVSRYPVSPHGKLYFQVETDGATRHDSVGIVVIDVEEMGVMMFDRMGRQYGNRPDPGYPMKREEIEKAAAGEVIKVGTKNVLLITALTEEAFRHGEFFLRSEHDMRIREDKTKAEAEAAAAKVIKVNMSFGLSLLGGSGGSSVAGLFAAPSLRKRPREGQTGFTVPLAGRPKVGKNGLLEALTPLHDPDRPGAVVLFYANYKRDAHGRTQVSVVVDPILGDKLRPHQRIGVKFLFDCITGTRMPGYHGAILADEMGLGKTIQTVAVIYTCLRQGMHGKPTARKCLVVTPSSLVQNWCNEFDKWLGPGVVKHFAISESTPKGDRIISRFDGEGDVLVISYDQLRKYITRISSLKLVELVVCDEGHRLKNAEVKTTKAIDLLPTRNRIILSGTPIQNDLSEFHAMVNFVNPGILGNRELFTRVFEEPVSIGRDPDCCEYLKSLGHDRAHYLSILTQRFILRRTQTINESYLPPKVDLTVFVKLGKTQEEAYQKLANVLENAVCTPLVLISAMRKLCNHMDLFEEAVRLSRQQVANRESGRPSRQGAEGIPLEVLPKGFTRGRLTQDCGSKLHFVSLMLDELRRNGEHDKLVIVSNFTQTLDIIAALCRSKKVAYFQLDGSTPIKRRQELVDYFNVPTSQEIVFLLSSKAGGVGLNLIGANRLILFDPDWNPANDAQAMGRVWRDGQKKRVFIYRLLSTGTIEEKIYQRQVSKQGLSANVVDMQEDSKQHFTLEELKALFRYKSNTSSETHDLLGCRDCESAVMEAQERKLKGQPVSPAKMQFKKVISKKSTGPRMDELKAWRHIKDIAHLSLDAVVRAMAVAAPQLLTLAFANERDTSKKSDESKDGKKGKHDDSDMVVRVEKPFESDEDNIICASQAAMQEEESQLDIEVHDDDDGDESALSSDEESLATSTEDD